MCSISGIIKYGETPILPEMLNQLLLALEHRGTDASGIAIVNEGEEILVHKDSKAASMFACSEGYKSFVEKHLGEKTRIVLLHTRSATKGSYYKMENNHPVYAGKCAIVHNGVITNDDEVFKREGLERKAEVDSDIVRAIVDRYGFTRKAVKEMEKCNGSIASICISNEEPGKVLMFRSGNPLIVAASKDHLFFASEKHAIHVAARPWRKRFGVWMKPVRANLDWGTFPDQSAWLFGPKGLEWHQEFRAYGRGYKSENLCEKLEAIKPGVAAKVIPITTRIEKKSETQETTLQDFETKTIIQCLHCSEWTTASQYLRDVDLDSFLCGACKNLARREDDGDAPVFVG